MNIKIGKYELNDWRSYNARPKISWSRSYDICYAVDVTFTGHSNIWTIKFWYDFEFLNKIHGNPIIIGTEDQVKKYTDNFLIRIDKLLAFS